MRETILVVDDEAGIRTMLKQVLTMEHYMVYTAANGSEALECISRLMGREHMTAGRDGIFPDEDTAAGPDCILLDVNMPDMDGYALCSRIREYVACPILFVTARIEEEDKVQGFRCGGDDYIEKPFSLVELKERIAAHIRRQQRGTDSQAVGFRGAFTISYSKRQVCFGKETIHFTKSEYEILELLSRNRNQVFTKEMIYEHLWGFDKDGESSIITEHIRRIRRKLSEYTADTVIETVWGVGYRWIG